MHLFWGLHGGMPDNIDEAGDTEAHGFEHQV